MSIFPDVILKSDQIEGSRGFFVTGFFLWSKVVRPTPNLQAGGTPLVGCLLLFTQCIGSYPP
jgi:hypothetical protein